MFAPKARPRVSIGVPVYNGERYLAATLDSLIGQTFEEFELIICDNASTDRTAEIARAYAARDRRIRYVPSDRNIGSVRNFNRAFRLGTGEYFRWFSADDLAAPESLARCVEVLDAEPAVVLAYPKTRLIDAEGQTIRDYDDRLHLTMADPCERFQELLGRIGYTNAVYGLMRTAAVQRTGLFGPYLASDEVFQAELVLHGLFWEIPAVLFFRRIHAAASSGMTLAERLSFDRPERARAREMSMWKRLVGLSRAVERSGLDRSQKVRLQAYLARTAVRSRDELAREVLEATRGVVGRLSRSRHADVASGSQS